MKAEEVVELYDSFWFELQILKETPNSSSPPVNPDHQVQEKPSVQEFSRISTVDTRSMSDQLISIPSFKLDSFSPDSVLLIPPLFTDSSGKDVADESNPVYNHLEILSKRKTTRRLRKRREHKSLSELEFEELKGFMDLGCVFSEEDKDSSLASIIPGLQRLGKNETDEEDLDESAIPTPYLSETWEVLDRKKKENPLMNWKIPAATTEASMKQNLKWWAHAVASTVSL